MLVDDIVDRGRLAGQCRLDQSHPRHPRPVVTVVDDDNDLAALVAGDPDDHARVRALIDGVSRPDRPPTVGNGHMACSHGAPPPVAGNVTELSNSISPSRQMCA